jgi:hypothetical protein
MDPASIIDATPLPVTLVELPQTGKAVEVVTVLRRERLWPGTTPEVFGTIPNKPALHSTVIPSGLNSYCSGY